MKELAYKVGITLYRGKKRNLYIISTENYIVEKVYFDNDDEACTYFKNNY